MVLHSGLTAERWAAFPLDQQLLMIANEMNRAAKLLGPGDETRLGSAYERVLELTDLTVQVNERRGLRRELLRWRDLVAGLYVGSRRDREGHAAVFRALLHFTPVTAAQLPHTPLAAVPESREGPA